MGVEFPPPLLLATAGLFLYPIVIYPALLWVLARLRAVPPPPPDPEEWPELAFVICALNEQSVIAAKLENTLALDYPPDRLKIVVVDDGSTDSTAEIVRGFASRGVELIHREERRGKAANLNAVVPSRREPLIVLSDANAYYQPAALRSLIRHFSGPRIGCVTGKVVLVETTSDLSRGERSYYSFEWFLQQQASRLHSMVGADGAMYAFRRELFRPCPPDTLVEDLVIPVRIVNQGYRALMEPEALARETGPSSLGEEFRRKVRIAAGAAQAVLRGNGLPGGKAPPAFWFTFVSHKLLRWFAPVSLATALLTAVLTVANPWSEMFCGGAAVVALLAAAGWITRSTHPLVNVPFYFVFGQVAAAVGLWRGITGRQSVLWAKANR